MGPRAQALLLLPLLLLPLPDQVSRAPLTPAVLTHLLARSCGTPQKPTLVAREAGLGGVSEKPPSDFEVNLPRARS